MLNPSLRHRSIAVALSLLAGAAGAQGTAGTGAAATSGDAATGTGRAAAAMNNAAMTGNRAVRAGAGLAHVDSAFMMQAAQNNSFEIDASKLALTKAGSADVKAFAQQMIDDHTKTGDEMKALAASKSVAVSDKPSASQAGKIKMLSAMSGTNFDKRYVDVVGVAAHKDTIKLFQKESARGKDADVKAFATKTLPALQHHLEMAQGLKSTTVGKS